MQPIGEWFFGKVSPYLDFALHEVVLRRRFLLFVALTAGVAFAVWWFSPVIPALGAKYVGLGLPQSIWRVPLVAWAFAASLVMGTAFWARNKWRRQLRGPSGAALGGIILAGFYETDGRGRLRRGGKSAPLESRFLGSLRDALGNHRVNPSGLRLAGWPVHVDSVNWRSPRGFAEAHDQESFREYLGGSRARGSA
jgi:hypothetical protein